MIKEYIRIWARERLQQYIKEQIKQGVIILQNGYTLKRTSYEKFIQTKKS